MQISFEMLIDWLEGRLSKNEAARVEQQLTEADIDTAAWLRSFLADSREIRLESPPPGLRASLLRHFTHLYPERPKEGLWQTLVASLTFDSRRQWAAAGLRSAGSAVQQQLIFSTAAAEVALDIRPQQDNRLTVSGQLFLESDGAAEEFTAELLREQGQEGVAVVDEWGEFYFPPVAAGVYMLVLSSTNTEILVSPLELYVEAANN